MWMNCGKSIRASKGEDDVGSPGARRLGSAMHWFREQALIQNLDAADFVGQIVVIEDEVFMLEEDAAAAMQTGIDYLRSFNVPIHTERRVDLSNWLGPNQSGTLDTGIVTPEFILIDDYKNGRTLVGVEWNEQLMLYALGFWFDYARHVSDATRIILVIDQPNAFGGGIKEWEISLDDLLAFGELARVAAKKADDPKAPGNPAPRTCMWCRGKGRCREIADYLLALMGITMQDLIDDLLGFGVPPSKPDFLTPEELTLVVTHGKMMEQWLDAVRTRVLSDALTGSPTPGKKAVYGRYGNRKWADEAEAAEVVLQFVAPEIALNRKIISPTQLEKAMGVEAFKVLESYVSRSDPKPTLVDTSDQRESILQTNTAEEFDDLEGED